MKKVITYGTYDLLHHGHIKLLERARELGDYLIVGVTSDDFDKRRGKINVQQSLMERIEAIKNTGLADEIIVEEYEGQKIDDIIKYGIDIFTVGSDWKGKFDYLNDYCEVKYLSRTEGVSSSELRTKNHKLRLGLVGNIEHIKKMYNESKFVNGIEVVGICTNSVNNKDDNELFDLVIDDYDELLNKVDAVYLISHPSKHYEQIKKAINNHKHVLCESPITLKKDLLTELFDLAQNNNCILFESLKTAYSTAYSRLLLLLKGGIIGDVASVDCNCTSLKNIESYDSLDFNNNWNSICSWGPTAMLPIFQILGTDYESKSIISKVLDKKSMFDSFSKIDFIYKDAVASLKVGKGVKSEGELIISGTKGYIYVPAPWWKTDYFEVRYEDAKMNKRYFYQLDGEGFRYELLTFVNAINNSRDNKVIRPDVSYEIINVIESFYNGDYIELNK